MTNQRLSELEWVVRALAQGYAIQRALFPSFVCTADELALEFEERARNLSPEDMRTLLTDNQNALLKRLDQQLDAMSGPQHRHYWTDDALRDDPEWRAVRQLAAALIESMGWDASAPAPSSDIYVGPPVDPKVS